MFDMFDPRYVEEAERKSDIYENEIDFGRQAGVPEEKIKELLVLRHGLTPVYAQNLLDCCPGKNTVTVV